MLRSFKEISQEFKTFLESQDWDRQPKALYEPIDYILSLGGKRVRPSLCMASAELFGLSATSVLNQALAVEVFHNFTLVHDDIMDAAPLRRGKVTVHEKWNANAGILSGDAMMILSYELLSREAGERLADLLASFNQTAIDVCRGQQMDMDFESETEVSLEDYQEMIRLKTAVLLAGSMELGAIMAGSSEKDRKQIRDFGVKLGLSFQVQDDILDAFGDASSFGKKEGGDIDANKKTILFALALKDSNPSQKERLLKAYSTAPGTQGKIEEVLDLYQELDIQSKAEQMMKELHEEALAALNSIEAEDENKSALHEVASLLLVRKV